MAKRFDATLKHLQEHYPADWARFLGVRTTEPVEVINADLATVTAEADKVFRIAAAIPWLLHQESQVTYDPLLGWRVLKYNVLLTDRHGLPVQSGVVLLRPKADGPEMTGRVQRSLPDGRSYHDFRYDVVRLWQQPVEPILEGGLGTLPLAPLADVPKADLPSVVRRMEERLKREAPEAQAKTLWASAYVLMGLRYAASLAEHLLRGVLSMEESVTYQLIVEEGKARGIAQGRAEEAKRLLLLWGRKRFGAPDAATKAALDSIDNLRRLEELSERLLEVKSWEELLVAPKARRRAANGRRR